MYKLFFPRQEKCDKNRFVFIVNIFVLCLVIRKYSNFNLIKKRNFLKSKEKKKNERKKCIWCESMKMRFRSILEEMLFHFIWTSAMIILWLAIDANTCSYRCLCFSYEYKGFFRADQAKRGYFFLRIYSNINFKSF